MTTSINGHMNSITLPLGTKLWITRWMSGFSKPAARSTEYVLFVVVVFVVCSGNFSKLLPTCLNSYVHYYYLENMADVGSGVQILSILEII